MRARWSWLVAIPLCVAESVAGAQGTPLDDPLPDIPYGVTTLRLEGVASTLTFPVDVADPADGSGRLFVNGADGRTYILRDGRLLAEPFVDLRRNPPFMTNGSAMSSIVFHPNFAADEAAGTGGRIYEVMTEPPGSGSADFGVSAGEAQQSVLYELRPSAANPDLEDPTSRREVLRINEHSTIHNLDDLAFGPGGYLFATKGDDQTGGQNTLTIHGTVLRIDVDGRLGNAPSANGQYWIPADNPFVGDPNGLDEIYAYGFRNPWRITSDSTGAMFVADNGEDDIEEIDRVELAPDGSAQNYGWNEMEGSFRHLSDGVTDDLSGLPPGFDGVDPVGEYDHTEHFQSVIGGVVYRGSWLSELEGQYVFGDWISGQLFQLDPGTGRILRFPIDPAGEAIHGQQPFTSGEPREGVIAVRADSNGELLVVVTQRNSTETGRILRVYPQACPIESRCVSLPNSTGAAATASWTGTSSVSANDLALLASHVPASTFGIFFYGPNPAEAPFGNGVRCVDSPVIRLDVSQADAQGILMTPMDLSSPPNRQIAAGETLHFQAWFRDPAAGGAAFNLSDALVVVFCP